jgi:predicted O-methyltransferase YrrM
MLVPAPSFPTPKPAPPVRMVPSRVKRIGKGELPFAIPRIDLKGMPSTYMNPGELNVLLGLARSVDPKNILEIGVNEGRTAKILLDNLPGLWGYQGIDVLPGYAFTKQIQSRELPKNPGIWAKHDHRFQLLLKEQGSFDLSPDEVEYCDVTFIDGDHSRKAVMWDTYIALTRVRKGGIIIWHDYHDVPVVDVKDTLDDLGDLGWEITHIEGTWLAYTRVFRDYKLPDPPVWA